MTNFTLFPMLVWLSALLPTSQQTTPAPATLEWQPNRPLTWTDFQARPTLPAELAALTSANLDVRVNCVNYQVTTTVRAVFTPSESWVRNASKAKPELLRHEQIHFDLTELHARRVRQKITLAKFNCDRLQPALNNFTRIAFNDWRREEARYDMETNHGLNAAKQLAWEQNVQQRLQELSAFAAAN
ncbi:DUF922 domain-containing protein [Hymenobacter sp. DG25A]|uniref:DUF922 domain-containing protein n=1 Tax=Hymenobacter sp. DG25A TaxID=1385663 RepID=UPI0009ECC0C9|nr:DUF922 domain-containing protein [Hymenobacter sp. DG25A]